MYQDFANFFPEVYIRTSPTVLKEIYEDIEKKKQEILRCKKDPVYLIIGPGAAVTPDAWVTNQDCILEGSNREKMRQHLKKGDNRFQSHHKGPKREHENPESTWLF